MTTPTSSFGNSFSTSFSNTLDDEELTSVHGGLGAKVEAAMDQARALGLTITSTTGGKHAPNSYHYRGRAVDVGGPSAGLRQFYRLMAKTNPTELFYDPMGGIKNGRQIGAIGGHGNHVHVAY